MLYRVIHEHFEALFRSRLAKDGTPYLQGKFLGDKMRLHYIQHADFEGLGAIEDWADSRQHTITQTKIYINETLPALHEFGLVN